jgi:hypothetical protein
MLLASFGQVGQQHAYSRSCHSNLTNEGVDGDGRSRIAWDTVARGAIQLISPVPFGFVSVVMILSSSTHSYLLMLLLCFFNFSEVG